MDPYEIFKNEPEEAIDKIKNCLSVLHEYKAQFENTRNTIEKYFAKDAPVKKWEFSNDLVFTRYDQFIKRIELIEVILNDDYVVNYAELCSYCSISFNVLKSNSRNIVKSICIFFCRSKHDFNYI